MRGSKLRMSVIKRQDFGITLDVLKALLAGWEVDWEGLDKLRKRMIQCVVVAVVIRLCGGLREGEKKFPSHH